jgi:hypothetical protein
MLLKIEQFLYDLLRSVPAKRCESLQIWIRNTNTHFIFFPNTRQLRGEFQLGFSQTLYYTESEQTRLYP